LIEAGHVSGSREYATGVDPFRYPVRIRHAAWHGLLECDDGAAFPRAKLAMYPSEPALARILQHREEVFEQYAQHLFAEESPHEGYARMKCIVNGLDMGSGLEAWRAKYGDPFGRKIADFTARVREADGTMKDFSLVEYQSTQPRIAAEMARTSPEAIEMVRRASRLRKAKGTPARSTWQSYVLQEAEAVTRACKIAWAAAGGWAVHSVQHDAIVIDTPGCGSATAAEQLSRGASARCGYRVVVKASQIETELDELGPLGLPPLTAAGVP
jgi:hypothetical protein